MYKKAPCPKFPANTCCKSGKLSSVRETYELPQVVKFSYLFEMIVNRSLTPHCF